MIESTDPDERRNVRLGRQIAAFTCVECGAFVSGIMAIVWEVGSDVVRVRCPECRVILRMAS